MQRIFAGIGLIIIIAGGVYYYTSKKSGQDPARIYEKAASIPSFEKAIDYVKHRVETWEPDPEDPEIRIPKNWGKSEITVEKYTFAVYSPDTNTPPAYYASFAFPKPLIKKTAIIKCWGTAADKTTDVCIVGNDPKVEAYFQILKLFKSPDFSSLSPTMEVK